MVAIGVTLKCEANEKNGKKKEGNGKERKRGGRVYERNCFLKITKTYPETRLLS